MSNIKPMDAATALSTCKEMVTVFKNSLVERVDAASMTRKSKIPFKIFSLKELLMHRMTALAESALELYESNRRVPSYLIVRATQETAAAVYNLRQKCSVYLDDKDLDALDDYLMKGLAGGRDVTARVAAINVMTLVDKVDREYPGYREMYDLLCEYAHPNFYGVLDAFGKVNAEQLWVELGDEIQKPPPAFGLAPLLGALSIFEESYNEVANLGEQINDWLDQKSAR